VSAGGWDLEEIRRRANIVDIVSPHTKLRKAGSRLVGLCPFHQERTGSFSVNPDKGLWYCFGCQAGGDVFKFVELIEKVPFQEAVEILARRLGLPPRTPQDAARSRTRDRLVGLHEQAARLFHAGLKGRSGQRALAYLKERGVTDQSIDGFLLGYAPDSWDRLLGAMEKKGFSGEELVSAGLAARRSEGGFYDRFRERVMFPISDASGRIIAFGGRALSDEQQPKYLNSPETPLFQKGQTLYAFDRARRAMADTGRGLIVEGYLDAIACHEAGFAETVATMGTALTASHVETLRRRTERLVLAFDSDSAGLAAALRGRDLFRQAALDVRVITMPEGMDPDNVIRQRGPEAFRALIEAAVPMIEWELGRAMAAAEGGGDRDRMSALKDAVAILASVPAGVEREYYTRWLARAASAGAPDQLRSIEVAIREELARSAARRTATDRRRESVPGGGEPASQPRPRARAGRIRLSLLAALLEHGEPARRFLPMLEQEDFDGPEQQNVFAVIAALVERGEPVTSEAVLAEADPGTRTLLAELSMEQVPERLEEFLSSAVQRLVEARLKRKRRQLEERLAAATSDAERERLQAEMTEISRRRLKLADLRIVGEE
jgi:DNA primase